MEGFFDIHTHILPCVDDGAGDISEAMRMVRMAWEDGIRGIILTPHFGGYFRKNSASCIRKAFEQFRRMAAEEFPGIAIYLGGEVRYDSTVPEKLPAGEILTLNGSHYVLLEFHSTCLRSQVIKGVVDCIYSGFIPVIAHVERYDVFRRDASLLDEVLDLGALIQINAQSILGEHGLETRFFCHRLLRREQVHFVASDCHHADRRMPLLQNCWKKVSKRYGEEYALRVFRENARAVIADAEL